MQKKKLNTHGAAQYLAELGTPFSRKTLEIWRSRGFGPRYIKVARKVFYDRADLENFAQGRVIETSDSREVR